MECNICYEDTTNITECKHIICNECMTKINKCAVCRYIFIQQKQITDNNLINSFGFYIMLFIGFYLYIVIGVLFSIKNLSLYKYNVI